MEQIDPLILQNDERHETLKNIEVNTEHQLLKQDEISEGIKEANKTLEHLLEQGDRQDIKETNEKLSKLIDIVDKLYQYLTEPLNDSLIQQGVEVGGKRTRGGG